MEAAAVQSFGPIAAMSMPVASSRATAASSSPISAAVSSLIQSLRFDISAPVQTCGPASGFSAVISPVATSFIGAFLALCRVILRHATPFWDRPPAATLPFPYYGIVGKSLFGLATAFFRLPVWQIIR
jgi:hypothetical protein